MCVGLCTCVCVCFEQLIHEMMQSFLDHGETTTMKKKKMKMCRQMQLPLLVQDDVIVGCSRLLVSRKSEQQQQQCVCVCQMVPDPLL